MKFEEMLLKRESCRSYDASREVSREDLIKICEAGRLSPSGCNAQPWRFVVIDDKEAKKKLCDALVLENGKTGAPWRDEVPAFIAVIEDEARLMPGVAEHFGTTQRFAQGDMGMACLNLCYKALSLGLSTCIIGMVDQKKMEAYFGIPAGHEVRMVLAVGYPKEEKAPRTKARKPFDAVVSFNKWS